MLAVGWEHHSVAHGLSQCSTKDIPFGLASVCIESGGDPDRDSRHLILYLNGRLSASVEIRREVLKRFRQPVSLHIVSDCNDAAGDVIILWSTLSLSLFYVEFTPPYRFQESSSFLLPPESVEISASMSFSRYLILGTADGFIWVFNCRQHRSSARTQTFAKRRLLSSADQMIISMSYSEHLSLFAILTGNQQLILYHLTPLQMSSFLNADDDFAQLVPMQNLSNYSDIYRIGFCGNRLIVGDQNGSLFFTTLSVTESSICSSELISIPNRVDSPELYEHTGPAEDIFCLQNGTGFCVRWRYHGAAVFSLLSMSCIYSINSTDPVVDIFMNEHCFVYANPKSIYRIDLARILSRSSTTLLGRDRVFFWNKQQQIYQELKIPLQCFVSVNDYLQTAVVSANGENLAIASSTKFALFCRSTFKWEIWSDQSYQILYWIGNHIIAAGSGDRLLLYSVSATSETPPAHIISCRSQICSIDCDLFTGLLLISQKSGLQSLYVLRIRSPDRHFPINTNVYLTDQNLNQFIITSHHLHNFYLTSRFLDCRLFWSYSTPEQNRPSKDGTSRSLGWIWSLLLDQGDEQALLMRGLQFGVLELTQTGHLIAHQFLYEDQVHEQGSVVVCTDVQRFWINALHPNPSVPELYIWVYSTSRSLHISVPDDSRSTLGLNGFERRLPIVKMELGVEPVEIWPESGAIASITRANTLSNLKMLELVHIKQISYVPLLLFDKILRHRQDIAHAILAPFDGTEYLLPALEFLLHYSMDAESGAQESIDCGRSCSTGMILSFLRHYDFYLQCVVRCARKTDFSHWGRLFPLAGTSMELFQECLRKADLETGSHYLMVLQRTEGSLIAHQSAICLLDALLHSGHDLDETNMKLALQLMRFIYMSKERNTSNYDLGTELQRRASDASASVTALDRNRSGPLPERRPSITSDHRPVSVAERKTSWAAGIIDWLTL